MKTGLIKNPDSLVTGATGLIGRWLVPELTRRGRHVAVALRDAERRADSYRAWVAQRGGAPERLVFVEHDLTHPAELDWPLDQVRDVYHLAALFRWHLPLEQAREANVAGALRVLRWAAQRPQLRRFVQVSGYRVSVPGKSPLAGGYERSKREAHDAILTTAAQLNVPLTVLNPASVIGDSATGQTTQLLGLGEMLAQLAAGKLPLAPGDASTFIPLVPVDVVASFAASVVERPEAAGRQYWLLDEQTPTLKALLQQAARQLDVKPPTRSAPVWLLRHLPERLLGSPRETLEFVTSDRYDTTATRALANTMKVAWPPIAQAWPRWLHHLASAQFDPARLSQGG